MSMYVPVKPHGPRKDVLLASDKQLQEAVLGASRKAASVASFASNSRGTERLRLRENLLEGEGSDPNGYERVIGRSDLTSINFLDRGRCAAAAVCRIKLPTDGGESYGTGFLVGPRLLLTNNHVLATSAEASQAEAEFGYEHDLDGVLCAPVQFNLRPQEIFFTSAELDITFVAVAPLSESNVPIERYGRLPLLPLSGKAVSGEWVSIIQHPGGQPKQIAIRASRIIELDPEEVPHLDLTKLIHYTTDTEPGSSGAPVFNDQWQVVAVHHKAVPALGGDSEGNTEEQPRWLANEGVRISAIFRHLEHYRFEVPAAHEVLCRLSKALGLPPVAEPVGASTASGPQEQYSPFKPSRWQVEGLGYNPDFLTTPISLDAICAPARETGLIAPLLDDSGHELTYQHFSILIHKLRKFALITAVNIDGGKLIHPGERKDTWRRDSRIDEKYQPDDEFYVQNKKKEKVYFSRGHLVRLLDPCWGNNQTKSRRGQEDTFHFTNAAPQYQAYNDRDWGNLEDYILDRAQGTAKRLTVFTGPVFLQGDPVYGRDRKGGPWQIPLSYWKIAVLQKTDQTISAAAFIVGQTEYVQALYETKTFSGLRPYTQDEMRSRHIQTTIEALQKTIREGSNLDFSMLLPFDAHGNLESTRQTRWLQQPDDIQV